MKIIQSNNPQGSPEWKAGRFGKLNASETASMLDIKGAKEKRSELLYRFVTSTEKEFSDWVQENVIDPGHVYEALARPVAEKIIEPEDAMNDLYPVVLACAEGEELPLSASMDGRTMRKRITWEHKRLNKALSAALDAGVIPDEYHPQMEQGFILSPETEKCLFMASHWEKAPGDEVEDGKVYGVVLDEYGNEVRYVLIDEKHAWYYPDKELQTRIIHGWKQFVEDAKNYQHVEIAEKPAAQVTIELPALFIHARGEITESNLAEYRSVMATKLADVRAIVLVEDRDFANAKAAATFCRDQIKKLALTKDQMLSQTVTIGEAVRTIDEMSEDFRVTALQLEKDVERKDKEKKATMITVAQQKYFDHVDALNGRIGGRWLPTTRPDFGLAIKGKSKYASMQDAVDTMLRNGMYDAGLMADRIEANRKSLTGEAHDWMFLFPDFPAVCQKLEDDFAALLSMRVTNHKDAEEKRIEAERVKIRAEEQAKAQREATANKLAECEVPSSINPLFRGDPHIFNAPNTVIPKKQQVADDGATIKLGDICARLGFTMTAQFVASLGFEPVATDRASKLYRASDFPRICAALVQHINHVAKES